MTWVAAALLSGAVVVVIGGMLLTVVCYRHRHQSPGRHSGGRSWRLACTNTSGMPARLTITASSGRITMHTPDGDAASLTPWQIGALRAALREAADAEPAAGPVAPAHPARANSRRGTTCGANGTPRIISRATSTANVTVGPR